MEYEKSELVSQRVARVIILTGINEVDFANGQAKDKNNRKGEKRRETLPQGAQDWRFL